jgi:hypothetical protein
MPKRGEHIMKGISLVFAALLALVCVQTASAQDFSTEQYNFRATFPGAVQQVSGSGNLIMFQSYSTDRQLAGLVEYAPLDQNEQPKTGTPDAAWWKGYEQGFINGGKDANLNLSGCAVATFQGHPADFCSLTMRTTVTALAGRFIIVYRDGVVYDVAAFYSVPGSYGDANAAAFMQSFAFLK